MKKKKLTFYTLLVMTVFLAVGASLGGCTSDESSNEQREQKEEEYKHDGSKEKERFESLDEKSLELIEQEKYHELIENRRDNKIDYNYSLEYDVIVVGTDPEGISAAVSSARNGNKTLLIDDRSRLGGLMTKGALNTIDMNYNPDGEIITRGIFMEFFEQIEGDSFNTNTAEEVFEDMVFGEENLTWKKEKNVLGPIVENGSVNGIKTLQDDKLINYGAKRVIDATQNGDMAFLSGVPYTVGLEDAGVIGEYQVSTLVFKVENIDWNTMSRHLNRSEEASYQSGATDVSAWGFLREMQEYESKDEDIRMRGLNLGRQGEDSAYVNALHIFNVNPLDKSSIEDGREQIEEELPRIVEHMRENLVGFEDVELVGAADEFYLREGRHIQAEYNLTINDVREHRDFWDKIAFGSYPVDLQPTGRHNTGFVLDAPDKYSIPFRSLVPLEVDDLLVVGKAAGFDSLSHGSARVIPIGMATGEAAGVAAAHSINNEKGFRDISQNEDSIEQIQDTLRQQGAYLTDFDYSFVGEDRWTLDGIRFMNSLGLVYGGYDNNFGFDENVKGDQLENMLNNALRRTFSHVRDFSVDNGEDYIKANDISKVFLEYIEEFGSEDFDDSEAFKEAISVGIISEDTADKLREDEALKRDEIYALIEEFVNYLEDNNIKDDYLEQLVVKGEEINRARFEITEDDQIYVDIALLNKVLDVDQFFFDVEELTYRLRIGDLELKLSMETDELVWNNDKETNLSNKFEMYNGRPMISASDFEKLAGVIADYDANANIITIE
ncbi:FAD-dependent oxidoreductase [Natranaerofaba carboxydovora]|uniref:FAD-dependent oxidoreductase n=1 Tax=Natranaerofaba carboxydovora TaxID=2742683 RepID=UPI001F12F960|nr:FAD-dependent oxidoreductase [Natranaerofaba carboxydovora]